ncbi:DUF748 domain-containing protein, partial [Halomonas sp. BBD48]|nr:DUF748 domain-containing protein [Halomonas sp. BBD48]
MKKRYTWPFIVLAAIVVGLVALRVALPGMVRDYLNGQLADMGEYQGHVEEVEIHLWRGAYAINGLEISKASGSVPVPFVRVDTLDLAVSWRALWKGAIVAEAEIFRPELNFVDASQEESGQTGEGAQWQQTLQAMVPIEINRVDIIDGRIHFRNFTSQPPVDLEISELNASVTNLSNADRREGAQVAEIDAEGLVLNQAPAEFQASLDPLGEFQNFDMQLRITDIDLTRLNDLTEAYGRFDFQSGSGDFVMELEANEGQLQGYAKPLLDNVEILDLQEDAEKGVLSA